MEYGLGAQVGGFLEVLGKAEDDVVFCEGCRCRGKRGGLGEEIGKGGMRRGRLYGSGEGVIGDGKTRRGSFGRGSGSG